MSTSIIRTIENKQLQLKSAIAADTREGLLEESERIRLFKLEKFQKIYSYQDKTSQDLLQIGRFLLKTYDTYTHLLNDLLICLGDYYIRDNNIQCSDAKKIVDVKAWYEKMKKLLIRFQAFTRGSTFMQFRLLFQTYYEVKDNEVESVNCEATGCSPETFDASNYTMNLKSDINNSFEIWTSRFTFSNVNRTSIKTNFTDSSDCSGGINYEFFSPSYRESVCSGVDVQESGCSGAFHHVNPFNGLSFDDIDLFDSIQISALEQFSADHLKLNNFDNTPYKVLLDEPGRDQYLIYFDCKVLEEYVETFTCEASTFEEGLDNIVKGMVCLTRTLLEKLVHNKSTVLTDFYYIEITHEYALSNLKFIQDEICRIINVDADELVSMVENGNILKERIRKLPSIGCTSIFSSNERKLINCFNKSCY